MGQIYGVQITGLLTNICCNRYRRYLGPESGTEAVQRDTLNEWDISKLGCTVRYGFVSRSGIILNIKLFSLSLNLCVLILTVLRCLGSFDMSEARQTRSPRLMQIVISLNGHGIGIRISGVVLCG